MSYKLALTRHFMKKMSRSAKSLPTASPRRFEVAALVSATKASAQAMSIIRSAGVLVRVPMHHEEVPPQSIH